MPRLLFLNFWVITLAAPLGLAPVCFAQAKTAAPKAPAKVEKALRARAEEFLQDYVDGTFSKAYELVAADAREQFLASAKEKVVDPKITSIEYSDKFSKAIVSSTVVRKASLGMAGARDIPSVRNDSWRLEKGKWVWYFDPTQQCVSTLIGVMPCSKEDLARVAAGKPVASPEKLTPEAMAERIKQLNRGSVFSKDTFQFVKGVAGTDEIIYHNGAPGQVEVGLSYGSNPHDGFSIEPETPAVVDAQKDVALKVTYSADEKAQNGMVIVISIEPFSQVIRVPVKLLSAAEAARAAANPK